MYRIGVVGCGYWGPNLVRNFVEAQDSSVVMVCDLNPKRLQFIKTRHPAVAVTRDYRDILKSTQVDAVAIATPVSTHYFLTKEALESSKHVLVEKPITSTSREAEELIILAEKQNRVLMVDHTFVYTGAVRMMKKIVSSGELGNIYYFDSVRVNLGLFQHDINVIWDLVPHDLSIMDYLIGATPETVSATGACHTGTNIEDIAYITVSFEGNLLAHFHVNWLAPTKIRLIQIGGSEKMLVFDDMENSEKIKVYNKGIMVGDNQDTEGVYKTLIQYRIGDMYAPKLDQTEALRTECEHFLECIDKNLRPITDGEAGLRVVKLLEATERSLKKGGAGVPL